eukprot:scaffold30325_cov58-Phaeocystis_antarctica.AAC.1
MARFEGAPSVVVSRSSAIASSLPVSWSEMAVRTSTSHAARRTCSALFIFCLKTKSDGLRPARTDGSSEGRICLDLLSTPCASTAGCVLPRPSCLIINARADRFLDVLVPIRYS